MFKVTFSQLPIESLICRFVDSLFNSQPTYVKNNLLISLLDFHFISATLKPINCLLDTFIRYGST